MPGVKDIFHHRPPHSETITHHFGNEKHFKPIPEEFSGMKINDVSPIDPLPEEEVRGRLNKMKNMLKAYEGMGFSQNQFAHVVEEMLYLEGGNASMHKGEDGKEQLIQIGVIGKGMVGEHIDLISVAGSFTGPDVQSRIHTDITEHTGTLSLLSEYINLYSHDPSREPTVTRKVAPVFASEHFTPEESGSILHTLGLTPEATLSQMDLHHFAKKIYSFYQSTHPETAHVK